MKPTITLSVLALAAMVGIATVAHTQEDLAPGPGDQEEFFEAIDGGGCPMGFSHARGPGGPGGMRGGGRGFGRGSGGGLPLEAMAELNLTDEQREKLSSLREQRMKAAIPIEADLKLAQIDLQKLLRNDTPDKAAVSRQADRISALRANLMKNRLSGMIEARAVLTPEQQKKLKELRLQAPERTERRGRQG
jgi:Spy/CpxP family protein refolding chaperone